MSMETIIDYDSFHIRSAGERYTTSDGIRLPLERDDIIGMRVDRQVILRHRAQVTNRMTSSRATAASMYITQEFTHSHWGEMDRASVALKMGEQLEQLITEGKVSVGEEVYTDIENVTVVKPYQSSSSSAAQRIRYLRSNLDIRKGYHDTLGDAVRVILADNCARADDGFVDPVLQAMFMHRGMRWDYVRSERGVADAMERLDTFRKGLFRYLDDNPEQAEWAADLCTAIAKRAAYAAPTNDLSATSISEVYTVRAGEIFLELFREYYEHSDAALALTHYIMNTGTGVLHHARHHGGQGDVAKVVDNLDLLTGTDDDEVQEALEDRGYCQCPDCGEWEHGDNMRTTYDEQDVCATCIDNNYDWSEYYDLYVHNNVSCHALDQDGDRVTIHQEDHRFHYDDNLDTMIHEDYDPPSHLLRRYHSAKNSNAYRKISSPFTEVTGRFMGVELEVEVRNRSGYDSDERISNIVEKLNDKINDGHLGSRVWFEEDGSLTNGFEIISNPMGLDTHTEFWQWLNDDTLIKNLRSHDTSTCGLHIHISRDALTKMQIDKMNVFINHPDNSELIRRISRRYATSYARIDQKVLGKAHNPAHSDARYEAFNLTNRHTVELRIFKGTIKYTSLMAALEFANALVNFTAPASPAGFRLDAKTFMKFLDMPAYRNETKFLRNYLEERSTETV